MLSLPVERYAGVVFNAEAISTAVNGSSVTLVDIDR